MKVLIPFITLTVFILATGHSQKSTTLNIDTQTTEVINFENQNPIEIKLKNTTSEELDISVVSSINNDKVSGFGLPANARVKVIIPDGATLQILNKGNEQAQVKYAKTKDVVTQAKANTTYVSFSLTNKSAKSIPLLIPGVMNPNLSPFSKSGVDLKVGQKILFRYKGKSRLLLVVDNSIANGATIEVSQLLKQKKKELDQQS